MEKTFLKRRKTQDGEDWSEKGVNDYKQRIKKYSSRFHPDNPAKILFVGETLAGKSSLISSFVSALTNEITYTSAVGRNYSNTTKQYLEHKVQSDEGILNFLLCDSRGIGKDFQRGAPLEEFDQLFDGKFRHKETIKTEGLTRLKQSHDCEEDDDCDKSCETAGRQIADQDFKPPNGVVFVQNANRLGEPDISVERKLKYVYNLADKKGIPSCLVLTHIDEFKPSLKKQLEKALTSRRVRKLVQDNARLTNFAANRVFVVWSYTKEQHKTNVKQNLLLLRALHGILVDVAQKYADDECSHLGPSYQNTNPIQHFQITPDNTRLRSELTRSRLRLSGDYIPPKEECSDLRSIKSDPYSAQRYNSKTANRTDSAYYTYSGETSSGDKRNTWDEEEMPYSLSEDGKSTNSEFGENDSTSSVGTNPNDLLQESMEELSTSKNIYPDDYTQVQLKGAKPLFNPEILQLKSTALPEESGLHLQLTKEYMSRDDLIAWDDVMTWAGSPKGSAWISHSLPADLGIPLVQPFPKSLKLQIFFLAPKRPAFFLSIYSAKYIRERLKSTKIYEKDKVVKEEMDCVQDFTTKMSRLMSSLLLNYCHSDFILLPCILSEEEMNVPNLQKQIDEQIQKAKRYYGGPLNLTSHTYAKLKVATTAVVSSTHIAGFFDDTSSKEERVLLLDKVWQSVVSLAIEKLHDASQCEGTYYCEKQAMTKVQIAVLEAAKRHSFLSEVQIISTDIKLKKCAERLRKQVKQDTGFDLKLRVCHPDEYKDSDGVCVLLDCSNYYGSLPESVLNICQRKFTK